MRTTKSRVHKPWSVYEDGNIIRPPLWLIPLWYLLDSLYLIARKLLGKPTPWP